VRSESLLAKISEVKVCEFGITAKDMLYLSLQGIER
jgi:hypothetical protein